MTFLTWYLAIGAFLGVLVVWWLPARLSWAAQATIVSISSLLWPILLLKGLMESGD